LPLPPDVAIKGGSRPVAHAEAIWPNSELGDNHREQHEEDHHGATRRVRSERGLEPGHADAQRDERQRCETQREERDVDEKERVEPVGERGPV